MDYTAAQTDDLLSAQTSVRLLIVEDTAADAELMLAILKRAGYRLSFDVVSSPELFREKLQQADYDLVLSNHNLKTWTGMDALKILRELGIDIPLIVATGSLGDEAAVDYLKHGAADYVLKHRLERLPVAVGHALRERAHRTKATQFQEQMLAAKRNWELTFDSVPDPILLLDGERCIQRANTAAATVFGLHFSELIGKHCYDLLTCPGESHDDCPHKRLLQGSENERRDLEEHRLGKIFDMTCSPLRDPRGRMHGCVVVLRDITDRRQAEAQILLQAAALESAANAILITSRWGAITWVNPAFTRLTGYRIEEVVGQNPRMLKSGTQPPSVYEEMWKTILAGQVWRGELTNRRKDGSFYEEEMTITPVRDSRGEISHFVSIKQDVSARRRAESEIRKLNEELERRVRDRTWELELANRELDSRRLEAERVSKFKDQFLSTMSHELRTPLNAVLGFSELLMDETYGILSDTQRRYLGHIRTGGQHLVRLVNEVLDLSRIEAGRMELVLTDLSLDPIVEEALETVRALVSQKSLHMSHDVEPGLIVHADGARLSQILLNFLGNAIKFTPAGGRIELNARMESGTVRVEVCDSGPGVPPEEQEKIFEAFYRLRRGETSAEGTGLGLAITKRLVELQHGTLGLESEVGKGSCFYFLIPAVDPREPKAPPEKAIEREHEYPLVLVIEDDPVSAQLIQSQLSWAGYRVAICENSQRAFEQAVDLRPSAITLDILMKPVSGWDVLSELRADPRTQNIPVIVTSVVDRRGTGISLGAEEYLLKPVQKKALLAAIERCFDRRGASLPVRPILVVEDDNATRDLLTQILSSSGFAVATAADGSQARTLVASTLPELVLLDLGLPKVSGFELLAEWRNDPRTSEMPVFVLSGKDLTREERTYLRRHSELLVSKREPWQLTLLSQLRRVLNPGQETNA